MEQKCCPKCGYSISGKGKFCPECGAPLSVVSPPAPPVIKPSPMPPVVIAPPVGTGINPMHMGKMSPVDDTLTMLAEYCTKTVATVGGDGYTEWVLNRRADGGLQLDYYRNYMGYTDEIHHIHPAPADTWDKIVAIKEKYLLQAPSPKLIQGMCGGYSVVKIRDGDTCIRLTSGSLTDEEREAFFLIQSILTSIGD